MLHTVVVLLTGCGVLSTSSLESRVLFPGQTMYNDRLDSSFDVKQQPLSPNCILEPKSSKEVASAVRILTTASINKPCQWAVRSGGHAYLNSVEHDAKSRSVKVGPGARWDDVFTTLEPLSVITTGGRSSSVDLGGLTLGGGISYFSGEHGPICDNTSNADLFTSLKGGNNNFGINHFKALVDFSEAIDKNPKASAIVMPVYQSAAGADMILKAYEYAEPVVRPAAFDDFLAIPGNVSDSTRLVYFGTLIFANDLRVMLKAHESYLDVLSSLKAKATGDCGIYVLYQPFPPAYWRDSAARGDNILDLERFNGQVLCLYQPYISWQGSQQDALFQEAGADLINRIRKYAQSIDADNPYLYLDYADNTQNSLASYGAKPVQKGSS
ncbi:FAD-binding domain-containing protein [Plenodomus tracheiphilus IPT5]|uniref:FAD-binding domain-containing protein n=1 Tax=Plenodomus tracheiphilus IPT5 TaxID=1408161 RepID=A0A6A7ANN4_9PLEO|nr:FAD-binding domain-containing protein [Plenodomus tracheiphilus IPT5]